MLARMKTMLAMISCSPPRRPGAPWPCQGKAGERIQMSRGMQAIRLIVMELGRFINGFWPVSAWWMCAAPIVAFCHSEAGGIVKGRCGDGALLAVVLCPFSVKSADEFHNGTGNRWVGLL
jgi:hypothetical protein